MSVVSMSLRRARARLAGVTAPVSVGYTAIAATLVAAAFATATSSSMAEPAQNKQSAAVVAPAAEQAAPAPQPAAAPVEQPAPAPQPLPAPVPVAAPAPAPAPAPPPPPAYPNNLDGWIRQSLDILHARGIPASYSGIHRNIIRESSGNPRAINLYDSNAAKGIPSKGLLQVIDPTFRAYHVEGTSWDIWDPVANIVAACNYAAKRYGSMDNVNSAY